MSTKTSKRWPRHAIAQAAACALAIALAAAYNGSSFAQGVDALGVAAHRIAFEPPSYVGQQRGRAIAFEDSGSSWYRIGHAPGRLRPAAPPAARCRGKPLDSWRPATS